MKTEKMILAVLPIAVCVSACPDPALPRYSGGCPAFDAERDVTPPRVIEMSPKDGDEAFGWHSGVMAVFTEPLDKATVKPGNMAVVRSDAVDERFISDFLNPPLDERRSAAVVPCKPALLDGGTELLCRFERALKDNGRYTVLLSPRITDLAGNPLSDENCRASVFRSSFYTGDVTSPRAEIVVPSPAESGVALNLHSVFVEFSEPLAGICEATFAVKDMESSRPLNGTVSCGVPCLRAKIEFPAGLRLNPASVYEIVMTGGISDLAGNPLDEAENTFLFTTGEEADETPPGIIARSVSIRLSDDSASVSWNTDEPSMPSVEARPSGEPPGAAAVRMEGWFSKAGEGGVFKHLVVLDGLNPSTSYDITLISEDIAGNVSIYVPQPAPFVTPEPAPEVVINEILANPAGEDSGKEFVELYNASEGEVDLYGWSIKDVEQDGGGAGERLMPFDAGEGAVLWPGGYALVVPSNFKGTEAIPADPLLLTTGDSTIGSGPLLNSQPERLELLTGEGAVASCYGGWIIPRQDGVSVERVDFRGEDTPENWKLCVDPRGATPGERNSTAAGK